MRGSNRKIWIMFAALVGAALLLAALFLGRPGEEPRETAGERCTLSVSCAVLLDHMEELEEGVDELVPEDGWLLPPTEVTFEAGESVFDALYRTLRGEGIHMEFSETPVYNSAYIEGIGNLYEMDCGPLSGWVYTVNGAAPGYGCSQYLLQNGDKVEFLYSLDAGKDVGAYREEGTP